jgi:hypothetical protein
MILPRKAVMGDCGAYIGAITERQAIKPSDQAECHGPRSEIGLWRSAALTLMRFHNDEPGLKQTSRRHSGSDG